jgi:hypothetical protein
LSGDDNKTLLQKLSTRIVKRFFALPAPGLHDVLKTHAKIAIVSQVVLLEQIKQQLCCVRTQGRKLRTAQHIEG